MGTVRTLDFWFDVISPNAYLAWTQLPALETEFDLDVVPRPVLFAGLLSANDRIGPAERRGTRHWMMLNCLRKARHLGIPLEPPKAHPFNPLLALRVAALPAEPDVRRRRIDRLFSAVWAGGPGAEDAEALARYLDGAEEDGAELIEAAGTSEAKQSLIASGEAAVAAGVFGVPTMIVDDALFWGYDDFPQLRRHLSGAVRLAPSDLAAWADVRPSARRAQHRDG